MNVNELQLLYYYICFLFLSASLIRLTLFSTFYDVTYCVLKDLYYVYTEEFGSVFISNSFVYSVTLRFRRNGVYTEYDRQHYE